MKTAALAALALTAGLLGAAPTLAPAQPAAPPAVAVCAGATLKFICGVPNGEDLVLVPRTDWIVASSLTNAARPGSGGLYLIDSKTQKAMKTPLGADRPRAPYDKCPGPMDMSRFSSHGLSIRAAGRGRSTLYVVGHGGREAIEVFDVATGSGPPSLTWAGCIPAPTGANFNSVTALSDGRVIATDFYHAPSTMQDALAGRNTGAVYEWKPGADWRKLAGTDLPGPNGVEVSPDRRYLFVAVTGTSSVMRYELAATQKPPVVLKTDYRTDNLRWAPDGKLLLAGPQADPNCRPAPGVRCVMASAVGALDPRRMTVTMLLKPTPEPTFTGLSSALVVGKTLWLGSYASDRVAYTPL